MSLRDVIDHKSAVSMLISALRRQRVSSSYIFSGESGIGKRFTALNFAKALNCVGTEDSDSCDTCISCKKIDSSTHPDFLIVLPTKKTKEGDRYEIRIDDIRRIEELLSLKSYEGRVKVVIVDDAEMMNDEASNAFLKTLEEPPPNSIIILITSSSDNLLSTIRSRCTEIKFKPLSSEESASVIKGLTPPSVNIDLLVMLCMGRPGLAIGNDLLKEREHFIELLRVILMPKTKSLWKDRLDMERWLDMLLSILRDMAVFRLKGSEDEMINKDFMNEVKQMCKGVELEVIIKVYEKLLIVRNSLGFNLNMPITWNYIGYVLRGVIHA